MVRRRKLKTRTSTLGKSREERIASAVESLASSTVYASSKDRHRKYISSSSFSPIPIHRTGYHIIEKREDSTIADSAIVPTSIHMHPYTFGNSPAYSKATSCSITTSSSLRRGQPPQRPRAPARSTVQLPPMSSPASESIVSITSNRDDPDEVSDERVEMLAMKNEKDRPFVRILVGKAPPKQQTETNHPKVEASASLEEKLNLLKNVDEQRQRDSGNILENDGEHNENDQATVASEGSAKSESSGESLILKTIDTIRLGMCRDRGASLGDEKECPSCPIALTSLQKQLQREGINDWLNSDVYNSIQRNEEIKSRQKPAIRNVKTTDEQLMTAPVPAPPIEEQEFFHVVREVEKSKDDIKGILKKDPAYVKLVGRVRSRISLSTMRFEYVLFCRLISSSLIPDCLFSSFCYWCSRIFIILDGDSSCVIATCLLSTPSNSPGKNIRSEKSKRREN